MNRIHLRFGFEGYIPPTLRNVLGVQSFYVKPL